MAGPWRNLTLLAVICAAIFRMATVHASLPLPAQPAQDPAYGEVLFQLHGGDDFGALARLLAAQQQGKLDKDRERAQLTLEWLRRRNDLPVSDDAPLARLLQRQADAPARDQAWFELGSSRYRRGEYRAAAEALQRSGAALPAGARARRTLLLAQALMYQGRDAEAAGVLQKAPQLPRPWQAYARYNLAVGLLGSGQDAAGLAVLGELGRLPGDDEELRALRDKANVTLGYAHLAQQRARQAKQVLKRVRLNGPFSAKALLGLGWAEWQGGQPRLAQVVWNKLASGDPADPQVQEALLGIPQTLWRLQSHTQAGKRFRSAIAIYRKQLALLDHAMENIAETNGLPRLLEVTDPGLPQALRSSPLAPYLEALPNNPRFQATRQRYRMLLQLEQRLVTASERLAQLPDGQATERLRQRQTRLLGRIQRARLDQQAYLQNLVLDELVQQRQRLQDYLVTARYGLARLLDEMASAQETAQ